MNRAGVRRSKSIRLAVAGFALLLLAIGSSFTARAQSGDRADFASVAEIETSFQNFLAEYRREIKRRNRAYLGNVHPSLPGEMHDLFLDITINMMKFSEDNGLEPAIECRDYAVCKVVYTQPDNSWAAQQFIFHNGAWRWLDQ